MFFPKVTIGDNPNGDDIMVTLQLQRDILEVGEGEGNKDSDDGIADETVNNDDNEVEEDIDNPMEEEEIPKLEPRTKSGRNVRTPERLIAEMNAAANDYEIKLTAAEENDYAAMREVGKFGLIGAGILGGGFDNTSELQVM